MGKTEDFQSNLKVHRFGIVVHSGSTYIYIYMYCKTIISTVNGSQCCGTEILIFLLVLSCFFKFSTVQNNEHVA